jgi:NhaP-type Na+/H+ or K+/H+ antiporter
MTHDLPLVRYILPYEWGWTESMLFGGIMSATDPVAVIALLKELAVMPELSVLIEGESILNDGTAIIVYNLCLMVLFEPASGAAYFGRGVQLVIGGPLLGVGFFLATYYALSKIRNPQGQTVLTLASAYLCYFVAEATPVGVSGVLAVFMQGILMAGFGRALFEPEALDALHAVWSILVYMSDTIVFLLAGTMIVDIAFLSKHGRTITNDDWGWVFLLFILFVIFRGFVVAVCSFYLRYYGHGLMPSVCSFSDFIKKMWIVTWGGLRGAVALSLSLR